ncbi:MAG: YicC family protein [Clostridiaceae bacterium]|nr:YicC family protein [Butyricicoccus pullicaecorum]MBS7224068.1 YicC family protein [Clostridiaceae bacterium]
MKSMTGYGRARAATDGREIMVELRAVNHRYLDVNVKCPRGYGFLEEALKKATGARISRGKVDIFVAVTDMGAQETAIVLNKELAQGYLKALTELRDTLHLHDDISVMSIARMPDVLVSERLEVDAEALTAAVLDVFAQAVDEFDVMRGREGEKMAADVAGRMQTILGLVEEVEKRSPERVTAYRERLEKRMNEILADTTVDPQRILTEAAIFADKTAVDEETVRLRSHLDQLALMLADEKPVGRKLDFLVQEMNREANTIGSKANDTVLANLVISLKAEIEKIREQIQNIE